MNQRIFLIIAIITLLLALSALNLKPAQKISTSDLNLPCDLSNPLANTYKPERFTIYKPCINVSGEVEIVTVEDDHDVRVNIKVDKQFEYLLNQENNDYQSGFLVVKITPEFQNNISVPKIGEHHNFWGPWVLNKEGNWNEIHPVWKIE